MKEEHETKFVKVYGDKHAKARTHPTVAYERTIHTREISFTCQRCQKDVTEIRYPGPTPVYCSSCAVQVKREKTAARTRRSRLKKKEQQVRDG